MSCDKTARLSAKIVDEQVVVEVGGGIFTCYKFSPDLKKPYLFPVNGPVSGESVTAESIEPYPHHNSLFFGCDRVNGANFWQEGIERGQIVSQGPRLVKSSGEEVIFVDECLWAQPGKEAVIRDLRKVTISAPGDAVRFIDFEITLEMLVDVRILKTNHSLFSVRVVPELSVKSGGTLINAQGNKGEKGTWGIQSPWCDYFGERDDVVEGIAILQHPDNPRFPSKWFTRDYGFFSPTPMYWPENDSHMDFAKGDSVTLKYRVVVHGGTVEESKIAEIYENYN
jgi:hypothetical protein